MSARVWKCRDRSLDVFERVHLMGIVNVTPDSFSDGGRFFDTDTAIKLGISMVEDGADIIDVGGESTRPGSEPVSAEDEIERTLPVIRGLCAELEIPISIDTTKSTVARAALDAGASIVNDVSAFRFDTAMAGVAREFGAGVVLMHMRGEPKTMQQNPSYGNVVTEVFDELNRYAARAEDAGISRRCIAIDPGIGFGKTAEHNLALIRAIGGDLFPNEGPYPLVVGPSRKSFIGTTLDLGVEDRLEGTAAVVAWLAMMRASVIRVHDVKEMSRIVRMIRAIQGASLERRGADHEDIERAR